MFAGMAPSAASALLDSTLTREWVRSKFASTSNVNGVLSYLVSSV